ncbi:MAG: VWA domain-containing protein, partial [Chloroflexales bacterium]|nr:VWA domain-containing protein [Chloroflexales bacterium]
MSSLRSVFVVAAVAATLIMWAAPAAAQPALQIRIEQIMADHYPDVELLVSVIDGAGRAVGGLTAGSFTVRAGGQSFPVTLTPSDAPVDLVIALDAGCAARPGLDQTLAAVRGLISRLGPEDEMALVIFSDASRIASRFSRDQGAVLSLIEALKDEQSVPKVALYRGVYESIRLAAERPPWRRQAVVLIASGVNGVAPDPGAGDVLAYARDKRVPIMVIGAGTQPDDGELSLLADSGAYLAPNFP